VLSELELRSSGNDQEILCALGNICHSEIPDKESFSRVAKVYKIDGEILEAEQKIYASFRLARGLGCWRQCTRMIYLMYFQNFQM